jgi:hypothetical protein
MKKLMLFPRNKNLNLERNSSYVKKSLYVLRGRREGRWEKNVSTFQGESCVNAGDNLKKLCARGSVVG